MKFNSKKCKAMLICRKKNCVLFYYNIDGTVLENVSNFNNLGIIVIEDLSWDKHIKKCVKNQIVG